MPMIAGAPTLPIDPSQFPIWNPAEAAGAGATFAGVLGALVVALTFQIAAGVDTAEPRRRLHALMVAPISLLLLLTAGYMYVVLSGTASASAAAIESCSSNDWRSVVGSVTDQCNFTTLRVSAAMFALGGSYLGLGSIALTFTLVLVARQSEHVARSRGATSILLGSTIVISGLALTWGYRDAYWVFKSGRNVPDYLTSSRSVWFIVGGLVLGGLLTLGVLLVAPRLKRLVLRRVLKVVGGFIVAAYLVGPFIWFLLVQDTNRVISPLTRVSNAQPPGSSYMTQYCFAWVSVAVGAIGVSLWLDRFRRDSNPDELSADEQQVIREHTKIQCELIPSVRAVNRAQTSQSRGWSGYRGVIATIASGIVLDVLRRNAIRRSRRR